MSRRDVRDACVVYSAISGFRGTGFTVVPSNTVLLGSGFYVLVPVLNEQAGDAMLAELKQRIALKVQSEPELFVFGSGEATKIVQDALWSEMQSVDL